ncbi:hypothetical protein QJS04_geneDACA016949 [Acorus gramineus]|uniref:COP1-interacting protein 7 n=1 Tax=Acorus gramineus TaxID=55184 RepID=A0AAV9AMS9_ACOGR|nr:hypothetical protein QJS04_geneDACA016949 [Acorus gramineus]
MTEGKDAYAPLDYAYFDILPIQNSYEAFICCNGKRERLTSGVLHHLASHLPEAKSFVSDGSTGSFRLQLSEGYEDSSWFTKSTLMKFLHIVGAPELLETANSIEHEMSQLNDARIFHLTLYSKDNLASSESVTPDTDYKKVSAPVETASSDATKNELLKAMDLRLMVLKEELASAFNRAAGATCSVKQISDLAAFMQHFGAKDLRGTLCRYLAYIPQDQHTDYQPPNHKQRSGGEKLMEDMPPACFQKGNASTEGISPARIAQAERNSSSESEDPSDSDEEDRPLGGRSRPMIRSASPRRSASPMRRIQIGRSGSRRSTALTIKSLSYFPVSQRALTNRDVTGNSSEDEESADQPPKKTENPVRRMSVQDAISLFESKQRDQGLDAQKRRSSEVSMNANKSVLRRWSAGMSDSSTKCLREDTSRDSDMMPGSEQKSVILPKFKPDLPTEIPSQPDDARLVTSSGEEKKVSPPRESPTAPVPVTKAAETHNRETDSAEWNRQKEAELNLMLMKMMELKPASNANVTTSSGANKDVPSEKRGDFYAQYKEKREEKLRGENAVKRAEKEAQIRAMQEILDQRKSEMVSKAIGFTGKQDSPANHQNPRRNSTPSAVPKKQTSKPVNTRKASPKASPLPAVRNSWPSAPPLRSTVTPPTKASSGFSSSTSTNSNRRKPQPTPSPNRSSPRTEKPAQQQRSVKASESVNSKPSIKAQEEKKLKSVANRGAKNTKTKPSAASSKDAAVVPAKPSFYNKVTKKSSVVPLESKPFLRKGSGIGPGVGPVLAKTKVSQSDESSKNGGNIVDDQNKEHDDAETAETPLQPAEEIPIQLKNEESFTEVLSSSNLKLENLEVQDQVVAEDDDHLTESVKLPPAEIQPEEEETISSAAWVENDSHKLPISCDNDPPQIEISPEIEPASTRSPHVRHSLSQMLQADNVEPEIVEWGNAENPPAMVYQKDAPKGFKRLLKFARKSKGETNSTGWASPSVFSDGEEDAEDPRAFSKKNADGSLRKAALQAKAFGLQGTVLSESYDGGNSSRRAMDLAASHDVLSGLSSSSNNTHKVREGIISTGNSTKARSFFSLSTFRSSKSSDTKLR